MLLERHGGRVRAGLSRSFGGRLRETELDEIMATATILVWRHARRFDAAKGTLAAWFLAIARRAGLAWFRDQSKRRGREIDGLDVDRLSGSARLIPQPSKALRAAIDECLASLPRRQRQVLEADLRNGDRADGEQLAVELRTSAGTVYYARCKGLKALKRALAERGFAPPGGDDEPA